MVLGDRPPVHNSGGNSLLADTNEHWCSNCLHKYAANVNYPADVLARFWDKTTTDHDLWHEGTQCIIWTASAANRRGYGRFNDGQVFWVAHRFAYALEHGAVPDGMEVDHLCRRPKCVNHLHLEAVTPCENRRRAERQRVYHLQCPAGHLWTRQNQQKNVNAKGVSRRCAQCNREKAAAAYRDRTIPSRTLADLTPKCRNGHTRTAKNTRFDTRGIAVCRSCQRDAQRRHLDKKRAA